MKFPRLLLSALAAVVVLLVGACESTTSKKKKDYPSTVARFMVEAAPGEPGVTVQLPKSGSTIIITPKAYFTEYDILKCDVLDNELGKCLVFQFTELAARDLYRMSATNQGRRIVTFVNAVPIGAVRIDRPINGGYMVTYVEVDEKEMVEMAKNITKTSKDAQEEMKKKEK